MFRRTGIAPAVLAVIVIIVIAIGGVAAYEVIGTKSSATSSGTTSGTTSAITGSTSGSTSAATTSAATGATSCTVSSASASSSSFNVVPFVTTFSAMKLSYNLTANGQNENLTEAYTRVYATLHSVKININATVAGGENLGETAWLLTNGTVLAINIAGENLTGEAAQTGIVGVFAGFSAEVQAAAQLSTFTQTSFFHSTGTQSVTINGNTFTVTNWTANALPETITSCPTGTTSNVTGFKLQVGAPHGTSTKIVTYFEYAGSETVDSQTSSFDYVVQVVSFTVG